MLKRSEGFPAGPPAGREGLTAPAAAQATFSGSVDVAEVEVPVQVVRDAPFVVRAAH